MSDQNEMEKEISQMSFEQALEALEEIVDSLESGNVALEASIQIYQRGNISHLPCEAKPKAAQSTRVKAAGTGDGEDPDPEPLDIG